MAQLEISVTGPGLDIRRTMDEGQSLLVGRDTDCDLCLPDPEKTVSRHHLALWLEGGLLQLRVLSSVNGVDLPSGEVPPGGVATLVGGDVLMVGDYEIIMHPLTGQGGAVAHGNGLEDDPFGEWGFDGTMVHRFTPATPAPAQDPPDSGYTQTLLMPRNPAASGAVEMSADAAAFFRGLGLEPATLGALGADDLESAGRKVRVALQGLIDLYEAKLDLSRETGADERTMVATRENNPLKTDLPLDIKLEYLLAGRAAGAAFAEPSAALADLVAELRIHDSAVTAASRGVVEGALREFSPAKLETRIAEDKSQGLLARLRPWDAYEKYYAGESSRMAQWLDRLFNRYFTAAYIRETTRIRREQSGRDGGRE